MALYVVGVSFSPPGLGPVTEIAIKAYETFFGDRLRKVAMPLFYTDSVTLAHADVESAKALVDRGVWLQSSKSAIRIGTVHCLLTWPCSCPATTRPQSSWNAKAEFDQSGFDRPSSLAFVIFCEKLKKGHEQHSSRGVLVGPIQDGGDTQFFEIRDTEGNMIQVCKEIPREQLAFPTTTLGQLLKYRHFTN